MPSLLSIIVPVLDEAAGVAETLTALAPFRQRGVEVIVADGGSRDGTVALARPLADRVLCCAARPRCADERRRGRRIRRRSAVPPR